MKNINKINHLNCKNIRFKFNKTFLNKKMTWSSSRFVETKKNIAINEIIARMKKEKEVPLNMSTSLEEYNYSKNLFWFGCDNILNKNLSNNWTWRREKYLFDIDLQIMYVVNYLPEDINKYENIEDILKKYNNYIEIHEIIKFFK